MDNMNKVISFILGLVVVVVFVAILAGRIGPFKNLFSFKKSSVTPTPNVSVTPSVNPTIVASNQSSSTTAQTGSNYTSTTGSSQAGSTINNQTKGGTTIPSTGSETLLLPLFGSIGLLGAYMKAKARKTS